MSFPSWKSLKKDLGKNTDIKEIAEKIEIHFKFMFR